MAILEVGIVFKTTNLITKKFTHEEIFSTDIRKNLLDAIFKGSFQKVSFGEHILLIQSLPLKITSDEEEEEKEEKLFSFIPPLEKKVADDLVIETQDKDDQIENTIQIYTIIEENTKISSVQKNMNEVLLQFLNKYSIYDITQKNLKKFKGFSERFADVFQDLALNYEDRFKAIF